MTNTESDVSIEIGDGVVVLHRKGVSRPFVAKILGCNFDQEGNPARLVLDRRVHETHESHLTGWTVHGAVVSVLEIKK